MKPIVYILILTIVFCCSKAENELTQEEAYMLINEYLLKDMAAKDEIVLFNTLQYKQPDFSLTEYRPEKNDDSEITIVEEIKTPTQKKYFSENSWNTKLIKEVAFVDYFNLKFIGDTITRSDGTTFIDYSFVKYKDQKIPFRERFKMDFGTTEMHNVSYPIFNSKTGIAIIFDFPTDIEGRIDCIARYAWYAYVKEENGWRSLKEYGIYNIDKTLKEYYKNTSL